MEELKRLIREFNDDRDWGQFHSPKNLAISISVEAAELLEHFQWKDIDVKTIINDEKMFKGISDELADIFIYALNLADKLGLSVDEIVKEKLKKNRMKYPVEKAKGSAKKYTEL